MFLTVLYAVYWFTGRTWCDRYISFTCGARRSLSVVGSRVAAAVLYCGLLLMYNGTRWSARFNLQAPWPVQFANRVRKTVSSVLVSAIQPIHWLIQVCMNLLETFYWILSSDVLCCCLWTFKIMQRRRQWGVDGGGSRGWGQGIVPESWNDKIGMTISWQPQASLFPHTFRKHE